MSRHKQSRVYDHWILVSTLSLIIFGLLMVTSASMVISDRQYGYPFHYLFRQSLYLCIGLFFAWVAMRISLKSWQQISGYLFVLGLVLLLLVLVPHLGKVVNGSRRWLNFGFISFQVSEGMKLFAILYLASYLERYQNQVHYEWKGFLKPMLLLGIIGLLLLLEPDFGAVSVIAATFLALLFIAGVRLWPFFLMFGLVLTAMAILAISAPYRLERLTTFLNPWHAQYGSGYQLTQSLIAFGRGGLFGVGLGNSIQKLFYLPEAHTDFLFAVIAEELGFFGELLLITLFVALCTRIILIGRWAQLKGNVFAAYTAYGIGLWLSIQAMINMGVSAGMLPTKGLTLPFISYGGSSMLINCVVIGIVLRISYEMNYSGDGYSTFAYKRDIKKAWQIKNNKKPS